ncbi:hypothetical protein LJR231_001997 [Phyllobacterium sp. LjRoot231]|uniref:hypothetical protein n=1 Tax=Phyllobacterium sp. LjRoot231 TaxID=3342289 RepID=UPI003ED0EF03
MISERTKNSREKTKRREGPAGISMKKRDWTDVSAEEMPVDDELAIRGERHAASEDAGDLSEDDDDNTYQNSDDALPDDKEEDEIARDPEREGHRFGD